MEVMDTENIDIYEMAEREDLGARFESFGSDDLRKLRLYARLCRELGESTFLNDDVSFNFGAEGDRLTHAGSDALRSMSMSFRQLWMQDEDAQFHRIHRILRQAVKPSSDGTDVVAVLDELGRRHRQARREVMMKHVWVDDPVGVPKQTFDAERVINDWLYGGQFHSDPEAAARVQSWSPVAYEWSLIKALQEVIGVLFELHLLVVAALAARPGAA
jgi:hypothetical protein